MAWLPASAYSIPCKHLPMGGKENLERERCGCHRYLEFSPAFSTLDFCRSVRRLLRPFLFVFKKHRAHLRRPPACDAVLNLSTVEPPAVERMARNVIRATHLVVDGQLLHKPVIWLAKLPTLADNLQGRLRCQCTRLLVEHISNADCGGAGLAHRTI